MAAHQGALQLLPTVDGDVLGGEGAEPGGHPVVRRRVSGELVDDGSRRRHRGEGLVAEHDWRAVPGDRDDLRDGKRTGTDDHR